MPAKTANVVKVTHRHLNDPIYLDELPPTSMMSHEGAATTIDETIDWTLHHLDAKFERTFPDDGVDTERVFELFYKMVKANLTAQLSETRPDTCPYSHSRLLDKGVDAIDAVIPDDNELEDMPATIHDLELLVTTIVDAIDRIFHVMRNGGPHSEYVDDNITATITA